MGVFGSAVSDFSVSDESVRRFLAVWNKTCVIQDFRNVDGRKILNFVALVYQCSTKYMSNPLLTVLISVIKSD